MEEKDFEFLGGAFTEVRYSEKLRIFLEQYYEKYFKSFAPVVITL